METTYKIIISDKFPILTPSHDRNTLFFENVTYRQLLELDELCRNQKLFLTIDYSE